MDDAPREDYRQAPRVNQPFIIRYRLPETVKAGWMVSPLRDLSSGGARFLSEGSFDVGAILDVQLVLPVSQQPVALKARVAWVKPARLGTVEVGITFDPGDTAIQRTIDSAVEYVIRKQEKKG